MALEIMLDKISNYTSAEEKHLDVCNLVCRGRPETGFLPLYLRVRGGKERKKERIREAKPSPNGLKASVLGLAIIRAVHDLRVGGNLELKEKLYRVL